jgi:lipoprotein-anchoring transpeptidase ErfK/SrfK
LPVSRKILFGAAQLFGASLCNESWFMHLRPLLLSAAALLLLQVAPSLSQDRYVSRPPVVVSPDLAAPWVMQLGNQPGRVVRRVSRDYAPRPVYRRVVRRLPDGGVLVQPGRQVVRRMPVDRVQTAGIAAPQKRIVQPQMNPIYLPREVDYPSDLKPGSIVIDSPNKFLYYVRGDGTARRYGVGVGKDDMGWTGTQNVSRKAEWPEWRPPAEMIAREKAKGRVLPAFMAGGEANPLGARALYLGSTLYRIHGTNAPWTIGTQASSGCIRMRNQDVIELYEMVKVGAKVVVM